MKLKESILREFGFDLDEGQAATNSATVPAAGGKDAIIKQIQAVMAELDGNEDPETIQALTNAQKAIDAASKKPDVAKPDVAKPDVAKPDGRNEMDKASDAATGKNMAAKIARLKELIRKQPGLAQAPAGTGADTRMSGPATTESILNKLRVLEAAFLAEDDRAEVDKLWSEIQKDLENGTISGDMAKEVDALGAEVNKYQQANPSKDAKPVTTKPDIKKPGGSVGRKNPGTMALQNWLNSKGKKVAVDGMYGDETKTAASDPAIRKDPAFMDMLGVGTAYNVKPGQGPGTMSLGDPGWLAAMKKYGYDPKTGNPVAGSTATKPAPTVAGGASAIPNDALEKAKPGAGVGTEYWVNGHRYEKQARGGWKETFKPGDWGWNSNQGKAYNNYTGDDSGAIAKVADDAKATTTATKPTATGFGVAMDGKTGDEVAAQRAKMGLPPQRRTPPPTDAQMDKLPESIVSEDNAILAMIRSIKI
jgi:hypothetical protein